MQIAGGLYREICLKPAWNGLYGSGGRAAMAVASVSGKPTLHTYFEELEHADLDHYNDRGIELVLSSRRSGVAFAYFHPLSTPYLEPPKPETCAPLTVSGDTVLRYGFVEGDAIVSGRRVIFDPQGWTDRFHFFDNGSEAQELALVLNAQELDEISQGETTTDAARSLIRKEQANVVVVKRGIFGATVIDQDLRRTEIPAFKSPRVFKIGTGDVFSALFALFWGEQNESPERAAQKASIGVANYAETQSFESEKIDAESSAISGQSVGSVFVVGTTNTLARHYLLEEAVYRLRELGVKAYASKGQCNGRPAAILLLSEGMQDATVNSLLQANDKIPVIILDELCQNSDVNQVSYPFQSNDFASAIYHAAWATLSG